MHELLHFLKHLIGLCGEPHPSLIMGGGALLATIGVYWEKILSLFK